MKTRAIAVLFLFVLAFPAFAADTEFCPKSWDKINMNGDFVLEVWGVSVLGGKAMVANPDYGWPKESAIASWWTALRIARKNGQCVTLYYSETPNADGNYDLWTVSE